MTGLLDDLARTLAEPMPRRGALQTLGAALAVATVPALRPRRAAAGVATGSATCPFTCDPPTVACCVDRGGSKGIHGGGCRDAKGSCCAGTDAAGEAVSWHCPENYSCGTFGTAKQCTTGCPPERSGCGLCCAKGQYCDRKTKKCCPPDFDLTCRGPEPECKEKVDKDVDKNQKVTCRRSNPFKRGIGTSMSGMREGAFFSLGCFAQSEMSRHRRYSLCQQINDDNLCPDGVRCDASSGLCMKASCPTGTASVESSDAVLQALDGSRDLALSGAKGRAAVLAELRRHGGRLDADAGKLERALARKATPARQRALAKALTTLARDVDAVALGIERVARGDASAAAAAGTTLVTLRHASTGLVAFAAALGTGQLSKALRLGGQAQRSFKLAAISSRRTRRVLGCSSSC